MMGVGFYSVTQKNEYTEFTSTSTDPGALIVAVGFIIFFVSFAGTIGALRENTTLLRIVSDFAVNERPFNPEIMELEARGVLFF